MGNKKGLLKSILPWLIVLMVISVAIPFFNQSESSEIRYDKFIEIVQKEKVKDVEIVPKSLVIDVSGTYSKKESNCAFEKVSNVLFGYHNFGSSELILSKSMFCLSTATILLYSISAQSSECLSSKWFSRLSTINLAVSVIIGSKSQFSTFSV